MAGEKRFENKIKEYLRSVGVYPFGTPEDRITVPICGYYEKRFANAYTKSGLPDLSISIRGYSLEVEVKAKDGVASDLQLKNIDIIRRSGAFAYIVYPSGWEKLKAIIDGLLIDEFNREEEVILK